MLIILFCHTHLGHVCSTTVWLTNNTDLIILSLCVHIASGTSHPLCLYPGVLGRHETAGGLNWYSCFQIVEGKKEVKLFFFIYFYLILALLLIHQFSNSSPNGYHVPFLAKYNFTVSLSHHSLGSGMTLWRD